MNVQENRKLVAAALRSGRFKQGIFALKAFEKGEWQHCCLGVACETYLENGGQLTVTSEDNGLRVTFNGHTGSLPEEVSTWLNMYCNGYMESEHYPLTHANDSLGMTFDQIADLFETADFIPYEKEKESCPA